MSVAASWFVACSDDADQLEKTCSMIVNDCHIGNSVGDCIDQLGSQSSDCVACISQAKCQYPDKCDFSTGACRLPPALLSK